MRLLLHIGSEKTGSTSVQRWLSTNDSTLAPSGVHVSRVLGEINHVGLACYGLGTDRLASWPKSWPQALGDRSPDAAIGDLPARLERDIAAARASGARVYVISNEHCFARLTSEAEVQRVADLLTPQFESVEVLCFLRPPLDFVLSMAGTTAEIDTLDSADAFLQLLDAPRPSLDYHRLVALWATSFGRDAITLVPYARQPNAISVVAERLGCDAAVARDSPRSNAAIGVRGFGMFAAMVDDDMPENDKRYLAGLFKGLSDDERLRPPREVAERCAAKYVAESTRLADEWPEITLADLTTDLSRFDEQGNLDLLDAAAPVAPQLRSLGQAILQRRDDEREAQARARRRPGALLRSVPSRIRGWAGRVTSVGDRVRRRSRRENSASR